MIVNLQSDWKATWQMQSKVDICQLELHCARSYSSNFHWALGRTRHFNSSAIGVLNILRSSYFEIVYELQSFTSTVYEIKAYLRSFKKKKKQENNNLQF